MTTIKLILYSAVIIAIISFYKIPLSNSAVVKTNTESICKLHRANPFAPEQEYSDNVLELNEIVEIISESGALIIANKKKSKSADLFSDISMLECKTLPKSELAKLRPNDRIIVRGNLDYIQSTGIIRCSVGLINCELISINGETSKSQKTYGDPDENSDELVRNGIEKVRMGNLSGAMIDFNNAIEQNPRNSVAYAARAIAKAILGDYKDATNDANLALEIDPKNAEAFAALGLVELANNNINNALEIFNKALDLNPKISDIYIGRATTYALMGMKDEAFQDIDTALTIDPKNTNAIVNSGNLKLMFSDYKGAIVDCNRALELNSKYTLAYVCLGIAKIGLGNTEEGCSDLLKADKWENSAKLREKFCQ